MNAPALSHLMNQVIKARRDALRCDEAYHRYLELRAEMEQAIDQGVEGDLTNEDEQE